MAMRFWLKLLLAVVAVLVAAVVTMPWWLGWVARPVAKSFGVRYERYERVGYSRFRLTNLRIERPAVTVDVAQVEAAQPLAWWWLSLRGGAAVTAEHWRVVVPSREPAADPRVTGLPSLAGLLHQVTSELDRWISHAELHDGAVSWPKGGLTLTEGEWNGDAFTFHTLKLYGRTLNGKIAAKDQDTFVVQATEPDLGGDITATWQGADVNGRLHFWEQPAEITARFPNEGWVPDLAQLKAAGWELAADRLNLGAQYDRVHGDAQLEWKDRAFTAGLTLNAAPKAKADAPEFAVKASARGDASAVTVESLHVDTPFAQGDLSAPVSYRFGGGLEGGPAKLTVQADLGRQPWFDLAGDATGDVEIERDGSGARLEFRLAGKKLQRGGLIAQRATVRGSLRWPQLELTEADIELDHGDRITARGTVDLEQHSVAKAAVHAEFGSALVARWLPEGTNWLRATIDAEAAGPWDALKHHGKVTIAHAHSGPLKLFEVAADWSGRGRTADEVNLTVTDDGARLDAAGRVTGQAVEISQLKLTAADAGELALAEPATIAWAPALKVGPLHLRGGDTDLSLTWQGGEQGAFALRANQLSSTWLAAWLPTAGPAWQIAELKAAGRRAGDGITFNASLRGRISADQRTADVALEAQGDEAGVQLTRLDVTQGDKVLTHATGRLPLAWNDFPRPHWRIDEDQPIALDIDSATASPLWPMLAAQAGVELTDASAKAKVEGTLRRPEGDLHVNIGRIRMADGKRAELVPDIEDFALAIHADRDVITLPSLTGRLAGQKFDAAGRLPMGDERWSALWSSPRRFDWGKVDGHLELAHADLAPIARHVTALPLAQGTLDGRIEAKAGKFSGTLKLRDGLSRSLGALGIMQDIDADIVLDGRRLQFRRLGGRLGGEPVTLQGGVTWPAGDPAPTLDLSLKGENLPLIRRPGLLLRGDLDLAARTDGGITRITGQATLRDGLVLADLSTLLPTGRRGVERRPPYFAVGAEPFNEWQLGVEIRGDRAVRIRTAVFKGTASAHFQLTGTLGEPRAIGEATVDQAQVLFPFATFNVQLGVVRLRASDPYSPELVLNAVSHRHDYEIRLNVTGSPEQPIVAFSSNPPLDSSQVLLMVMTGQSPADDPAARTGQQRLTQLGAYLGRGLFGDLGGENRLEIVAGEQTSQQGRETYEIEYKLGDKWSLTGEYDRFDDYNAGLKWRVYTQDSQPDDSDDADKK